MDIIKEIINNIMRSAFSLEGTVGEGVGSSLASQKFSVEQLNTLSRMLHHLQTKPRNRLFYTFWGIFSFLDKRDND